MCAPPPPPPPQELPGPNPLARGCVHVCTHSRPLPPSPPPPALLPRGSRCDRSPHPHPRPATWLATSPAAPPTPPPRDQVRHDTGRPPPPPRFPPAADWPLRGRKAGAFRTQRRPRRLRTRAPEGSRGGGGGGVNVWGSSPSCRVPTAPRPRPGSPPFSVSPSAARPPARLLRPRRGLKAKRTRKGWESGAGRGATETAPATAAAPPPAPPPAPFQCSAAPGSMRSAAGRTHRPAAPELQRGAGTNGSSSARAPAGLGGGGGGVCGWVGVGVCGCGCVCPCVRARVCRGAGVGGCRAADIY